MVATAPGRVYNRNRKSQGLDKVDWLVNALEPLVNGKATTLAMFTSALPRRNTPPGSMRRHLVAVAPGPMYGFKDSLVLVSVIGLGSCVINPLGARRLSELLKAGIPHPLAVALFDGLHRLYWSKHNGTSDPSHTSPDPNRQPGTRPHRCTAIRGSGERRPRTPRRRSR